MHTPDRRGLRRRALDAANILKPALSPGRDPVHRRDHARASTASTSRRTASLERRFQAVKVDPPDEAESMQHHRGHHGPLREVPPRALHRRGHGGRGLPVQPLHHGPLPARQGHRPAGRGGGAGEAAGGGRRRRQHRGPVPRGGAAPGHQRDERGRPQPRFREGRPAPAAGAAAARRAPEGSRRADGRGLRPLPRSDRAGHRGCGGQLDRHPRVGPQGRREGHPGEHGAPHQRARHRPARGGERRGARRAPGRARA